MIILVDTGVFSAGLARKPRADLAPYAARMVRNQVLLTVQTVAELRYGALVAGWGSTRAGRLDRAIEEVDIVPIDAELVERVAQLRYDCRTNAHPLHERIHTHDLWIATTAIHLKVPLLSTDSIFEDTPGLNLLR